MAGQRAGPLASLTRSAAAGRCGQPRAPKPAACGARGPNSTPTWALAVARSERQTQRRSIARRAWWCVAWTSFGSVPPSLKRLRSLHTARVLAARLQFRCGLTVNSRTRCLSAPGTEASQSGLACRATLLTNTPSALLSGLAARTRRRLRHKRPDRCCPERRRRSERRAVRRQANLRCLCVRCDGVQVRGSRFAVATFGRSPASTAATGVTFYPTAMGGAKLKGSLSDIAGSILPPPGV